MAMAMLYNHEPDHYSTPSTPRPPPKPMTTVMEEIELHYSTPPTPKPVSTPPSQLHSPSLTRSPLLGPTTPRTSWLSISRDSNELKSLPITPRFTPTTSAPPSQLHSPRRPRFTPLPSPIRKAIVSMRGYLEEVGHVTRLDPQDEWLPITQSRNGNAYYSAFHTLSSGIGFQALVLPLAFTYLGWTWGILSLSAAFIWQLYTLWLLVELHESVPGTRYSRYLHLANDTFAKYLLGPKVGNFIVLFPIMYLSAGTCSALVIVGGGTLKGFFQIVCGPTCRSMPLTTVEWYIVFICLAVVLSQLPHLNSIAGISLVGALTAVTYCTMIWTISLNKGKIPNVSYKPVASSDTARVLSILNALGIIAFAFRGHNLVLEIQGTMPSSQKHPARVPMWRGVKVAYVLIAFCLFPITLVGFWAYGNQIPSNGVLAALNEFHSRDTSSVVLGLTTLLVVINCLSSFQIYAMPVFDQMESGYTSKNNKPCPQWLRSTFRAAFGAISFLIAVAFPFLPQLAGLVGALALPVTLAYPCFMWIAVKKPEKYSAMWYINWSLGIVGMVLSVVLVIGSVWRLIEIGVDISFFDPQ